MQKLNFEEHLENLNNENTQLVNPVKKTMSNDFSMFKPRLISPLRANPNIAEVDSENKSEKDRIDARIHTITEESNFKQENTPDVGETPNFQA